MFKKLMTTAALLALAGTPALAHITLQVKEAHVGGGYKAILQVPHGCDGKATTAVHVQIPDGVIAVKPQPKPGWKLEKVKGAYKKSYDYYGTPTNEGVKEVVWNGGSLGDDEYDEFALRVFLTTDLKPGDTLYFPVVQECGDGVAERWIEIPAAGQTEDDVELPAPGMKLLDKASDD